MRLRLERAEEVGDLGARDGVPALEEEGDHPARKVDGVPEFSELRPEARGGEGFDAEEDFLGEPVTCCLAESAQRTALSGMGLHDAPAMNSGR